LVRIFQTQLASKWPFSFSPHPAFVFALPGEAQAAKYHFFIQCDMIA